MTPFKQRLLEDRALRDAARGVLDRQVAYLKDQAQQGALTSRAVDAGVDYARVVAEGALNLASEHRGKVGAGMGLLAAGLAAWFFRAEIADFAAGLAAGDEAEPTAPSDISDYT